jgi:hypothetical protein
MTLRKPLAPVDVVSMRHRVQLDRDASADDSP